MDKLRNGQWNSWQFHFRLSQNRCTSSVWRVPTCKDQVTFGVVWWPSEGLSIPRVYLCLMFRFLFKFTGNESEINLLGDGSEKPEFSEWKWAPVEDVVNHVWLLRSSIFVLLSLVSSVYEI